METAPNPLVTINVICPYIEILLKYYKKNEVLIDVTAQMNLGNFRQREREERLHKFHFHEMSRREKSIKTEKRLVVP